MLYHHSHQQGHTLLARHSGSDAALLHTLLLQHSGIAPSPAQPLATSNAAPQAPAADSNRPRTEAEIEARCHELMNKHKVMLFMKGNPSSPKCGFSRQTVGLLREKGVEFAWFDILSDEDVRQGLKKVNDWPSELSKLLQVYMLINSFPPDHPQWRITRWFGHLQGDVGVWRIRRGLGG